MKVSLVKDTIVQSFIIITAISVKWLDVRFAFSLSETSVSFITEENLKKSLSFAHIYKCNA